MSTTTIPASTELLLSMKNIKFTNMHNQCGWEPRRNLATGDADFQDTIQNQCYGPPPLIQNQCVWKPRKDFITENMEYKGIHNQCLGVYCTDSTAETNGNSTQQIPQPRGQPAPTPPPPQSHFGSASPGAHRSTGTSASTKAQKHGSNSPVDGHLPPIYRANAHQIFARAEKWRVGECGRPWHGRCLSEAAGRRIQLEPGL